MKKTSIVTTILAAGTLTAQAADYQYLTFEKTDGTSLSLTAVGLTISYNGTTMTAANSSETATVALAELSRMYFSNTKDATPVSGIETLEQDADAVVFSLSGRQIASGRLAGIRQQLDKGVYIVKQNGRSHKVQVR